MIPENAAKLCQEFCSENNEILASCSFSEKSMEHIAIRFIQRVAAGVQVDGSDGVKNVSEGETGIQCAISEDGVGCLTHSSHDLIHGVAVGVQFADSDYIKNDAKQFSHLESEGFFNLPPTISYSADFQGVAVGVQVAEGDDLNKSAACLKTLYSGHYLQKQSGQMPESFVCAALRSNFQCVAVGVQVAEGDGLSPLNKVKSIKCNSRKSESSLKNSPAISQNFNGVQ
jgi:hypothetical protein